MKKLITTLLAAFAATAAMADATVDGATYVDLTTDGAGTASSTNAEYYGYTMMGAFDNSWAGSANRALSPYSTTYPGMYVDYTFNTPTVVNAYSIRAADAGAGQPVLRAPNTWTLEGSDDGTTWTVLDSRSGVNNWTRGEVRLYEIANAHAYGHYRFSCTALNGRTDCLELHEIEFYFISVPAVPAAPDVADGGAAVSANVFW